MKQDILILLTFSLVSMVTIATTCWIIGQHRMKDFDLGTYMWL